MLAFTSKAELNLNFLWTYTWQSTQQIESIHRAQDLKVSSLLARVLFYQAPITLQMWSKVIRFLEIMYITGCWRITF